MTTSTPRAQQHATRAAFFMPGFAAALWAPLVPYAKHAAGLDEATLGAVLLCLGGGSLLAMPVAGALTARLGCRRVLVATMLMFCIALPGLALMQAPWTLAATLFLFGAGMGAMDCVMNMQAIVVERASGRTMMSGFHAFYSIGGFVGAAFMTVLLSSGLAPWLAAALGASVVLGLAAFSVPHWRAEPMAQDGPLLAWPRGVVLFIGALCFVVFLAEGSMLDWSAVFLTQVRAVAPSMAGAGYVVFALSMTVTRLFGDGAVEALGRSRSILLGGAVAGGGFLLATWTPSFPLTLVGYGLVGLGCANIVPALFSMAGQQRVMPESIAIPAVTTLAYAGVLAGPAAIGFIAHVSSLTLAFTVVALALLAVAAASRMLKL